MTTLAIVPTPIDLLAELEDVRLQALAHQRVWIARSGEQRAYDDPDYRAAIQATRVKAEICGYIRQTPTFETPMLVEQAMRRALSDPELRRMLVAQLREIEPELLADGEQSG